MPLNERQPETLQDVLDAMARETAHPKPNLEPAPAPKPRPSGPTIDGIEDLVYARRHRQVGERAATEPPGSWSLKDAIDYITDPQLHPIDLLD